MTDDPLKNAMPSERAAGRIEDSAERIRDEAHKTAVHLKDAGKAEAEARLDQAGSGLGTTAERLRSAAGELEGKDAWIGSLLERTADTAEQAGRYLSGQDMNSVIADTQELGRRNPGAFLGGAAALGFVLARAGKATVERADTGRIARAAKGESSAPVPASTHAAGTRDAGTHDAGTGGTRTQTAGAYSPGVAPRPASATPTPTPIAPVRTGPNGGNL